MVGLAELEHHVIGHVDHRAYGPHPGQSEPARHQWRHHRIGHPFYDRASETGAQAGGVSVHRHPGPFDALADHVARLGDGEGGAQAGGEIPGHAGHAQAVAPVGAHLEVEDDVLAEAEHVRQCLAGLAGTGRQKVYGRGRAFGPEAELESGAEHPVGPLPPQLAPSYLQAAGHDRAQGGQGDQVARLHVERATADLQRLAVAGVNVDEMDPVGGGVGPGGEDLGDDDARQDRAYFLRTLDH